MDVDLNSVVNGPKLTPDNSKSIEGNITVTEALEALKKMENNKSPGSDGYTVEFLKFFWSDIGIFLVRSINESFTKGEMSTTQRQGIITCIPKEGKEKKFLKNWRPITLLNTSYKIASACIAQRLKTVLPSIIHESQTGFLPGRNINQNIRLLYDVLVHTDTHKIPGLLLLIDFEKAFDTIAWSFINKALDFFCFGPDIKRWINTFYSNTSACVTVNGGYTSWFQIQRGVRQGDPCSSYLYLICAEILSLLIRNNKKIKGIKIADDVEALLSQFADDTTLFLDGSRRGFEESINCLNYFTSISGLKISSEKTQVVWIGGKKNSQTRYMQNIKFKWNPEVFKVLGLYFTTSIDDIVSINYKFKLTEIKKVLLSWSKRHLTPLGKITVIKSLALSKIVHLILNLPDPPYQFLSDLKSCLYSFLWNNKKGKIKQSTVCMTYEHGGLKMIDVFSFVSAMKIRCLRGILSSESFLKKVLKYVCPEILLLEKYGGEYANILMSRCCNRFWFDVSKHYKKLYNMCVPENSIEFLSECIHYNVHIVRANKTVHIKEWMDVGILRIGDLVNNVGNFYTYNEFKNLYQGLSTDFLTYAGVIDAIKEFKQKYKLEVLNDNALERPKAWHVIKSGNIKNIYKTFIECSDPPTSVQKWQQTYPDEIITWKKIFLHTFKVTKENKLRWFQYRILHRQIPTQKYLFVRKLVDNPTCIFCGEEEDSVQHLMWRCPVSQNFWTELTSLLSEVCQNCRSLTLSELYIIFGVNSHDNNTDKVLDLIILLGKFHLYKCKLQNSLPNIMHFKNIIKIRYYIEKYNSRINDTEPDFENIWLPYITLIEN